MVTGRDFELMIMERLGSSWTEAPVPNVSIKDLSLEAISQFKNMGLSCGRLTNEEAELGSEELLEKLDLIRDGMMVRSAVLLFHPNPSRIMGPTSVKMGMFDGSDLLYMDEFTGPLIFTANRAIDTLLTKYMFRPVKYDGIVRKEIPPYPEPAIREALMNAIVHNDYSSHVPIQVKVFAKTLTIYNEGGLPKGWTVDRLMGQHKSLPRNPSLASAFFRAGLIEAFGRGIGTIMKQYEGHEDLRPVFESDQGFSITFKSALSDEGVCDDDTCSDASMQGERILEFIRKNGPSTYLEVSSATGIGVRQIQRLIGPMVEAGDIRKQKRGRNIVLSLEAMH